MKPKVWLLMSLIALGITACEYDDSALKADVNDLKDRISALEEQVNQMNEDIVSLQDIIHALDQNISISQVEQTDEGYILHLTDGTSINLYNGKEGSSGANAPIIGIAQENGIYYWTLTTDEKTTWLTDEAGNKLPVSGASGITPLLSIDEKIILWKLCICPLLHKNILASTIKEINSHFGANKIFMENIQDLIT